MLDRLVFPVSERSLIGWLFIAFLVLGSLYLIAAALVGIARKVKDPEWRGSADKWTWLKLTVVALLFFAGTSVTLLSGFLTAVLWLRY